MRALLDTHAFFWWITDDSRLSLRARETLDDGRNDLFFSAASGWEIAIKAKLGKVEVPDDLDEFLAAGFTLVGYALLENFAHR